MTKTRKSHAFHNINMIQNSRGNLCPVFKNENLKSTRLNNLFLHTIKYEELSLQFKNQLVKHMLSLLSNRKLTCCVFHLPNLTDRPYRKHDDTVLLMHLSTERYILYTGSLTHSLYEQLQNHNHQLFQPSKNGREVSLSGYMISFSCLSLCMQCSKSYCVAMKNTIVFIPLL